MKFKKLTSAEINSGNKLISYFITGAKCLPAGIHKVEQLDYHRSWNSIMPVRDKIHKIGAHLNLGNDCELIWWYSAAKKNTFSSGSGPWSTPRTPFDGVGGKHYSRYVSVGESEEVISRETEILALWDNIAYFIKWFNRTCPHLRNHIEPK